MEEVLLKELSKNVIAVNQNDPVCKYLNIAQQIIIFDNYNKNHI